MNSKERVRCALSHKQPDRVPVNFQATPIVSENLCKKYNCTPEQLYEKYEVDIREIWPRYTGKRRGEWTEGGAHYVRNQYGYVDRLHRMENNEFVYVVDRYPFGEDTTVEDIEKYLWTTPDEFDYEDVKRQCDAFQNKAIIVGHEGPFQMGTFMMNMEILFLKMSIEPEVAKRLFDRFVEFELEYYERVLMACDGQIDILRPHDDYGTQISTLFSVGMWNEFFRDNTKKLADLAHKYKAFYQQHSCGRIGSLIPSLIECGVDSLEPIQKVEGLEIDVLKKKYGDKLCFHGGIDTQHLLPRGSVEDVTKEVEYFIKTANVNGGYILMGSQEYQSDIPLENIEAIYRADRN